MSKTQNTEYLGQMADKVGVGVICAIILLLMWYSRRMTAAGVLR